MSKYLRNLKNSFTLLPGIGSKTADRLSYFLLQNRKVAAQISKSIEASERIVRCNMCNNWSDHALCPICEDTSRNTHQVCVVLNPSGHQLIEQLGIYKGRYFVIHQLLSPIDQIGPEQLEIQDISNAFNPKVTEIIFTLPNSPEGKITTQYLRKKLHALCPEAVFSRIAQGVPFSSELEYIDAQTMAHAIESRQIFD